MKDDHYEIELRPKLTDEFLATLAQAARTAGWSLDHTATAQFVDWCYDQAAMERVPLDVFEDEPGDN